MAAKAISRSSSSPKGESKQGLVVTLVFFILATIGLGVSTYFGFSEQETLRAEKDKSDATQKSEAKLIDFYKFQSMLYWTYISTVNGFKPEDLEIYEGLRAKVDDETILPKDAKYDPNKEELKLVKTRMEMLEKMAFKDAADKDLTLKFDKATKKPSNTFDEITSLQSKRYLALKERFDKVEMEKKEAQDAEKKSQDEFAAFKADINKKFAGLTDTAKKEFSEFTTLRDQLRKQKDELTKALTAEKTERSRENEEFTEKIAKLEKKSRDKELEITALADQLVLTKTKGNDIGKNIRPDYKIVSIDRTGSLPYINVGHGDRVNPQDTFSIHGIGTDGRPLPEIKGTLEVINVVGEHLAQCKILTVKDTNKDPILKGDVLYNPTWNPNSRKRIAIMGIVDLTGDGKDQIYELIGQLERQGVLVDAYLDPSTLEIRNTPGISPKTDLLIIGDGIDSVKAPRGVINEKMALLNKSINEMRVAAKENGVISIDLRKYLEMSGYRVPKNYFQLGPNPNPVFTNKPNPKGGAPVNKEEPAKEEAKKAEPEEKKEK
jgi:hypothetical protein